MLKDIFSGASIVSLLVSGLVGAGVSAWPVWSTAHSAGVGSAQKRHITVEDRMFAREGVLLFELGAERQQRRQQQEDFIAIIDGTDAARADAKKAYQREKVRADRAVEWVADALKELDRVENDWKGKPVPADVIKPFCVRFAQTDCQAAPAGAGIAENLEVRGTAAGGLHAGSMPASVEGHVE